MLFPVNGYPIHRSDGMRLDFKKALPKDAVPENSSMARNMEEMKELGEQMEKMLTAPELKKKQGLQADPIQFTEKETKG